MKGVTEMRLTQDAMLDVVQLWLRKELLRGMRAKNFVSIPVSVTQNTQTKEFIIKLKDATIVSES